MAEIKITRNINIINNKIGILDAKDELMIKLSSQEYFTQYMIPLLRSNFNLVVNLTENKKAKFFKVLLNNKEITFHINTNIRDSARNNEESYIRDSVIKSQIKKYNFYNDDVVFSSMRLKFAVNITALLKKANTDFKDNKQTIIFVTPYVWIENKRNIIQRSNKISWIVLDNDKFFKHGIEHIKTNTNRWFNFEDILKNEPYNKNDNLFNFNNESFISYINTFIDWDEPDSENILIANPKNSDEIGYYADQTNDLHYSKKSNLTRTSKDIRDRNFRAYIIRENLRSGFMNNQVKSEVKNPDLLTASHIYAVSDILEDNVNEDTDKLKELSGDVDNGILVPKNFDALFDNHLITFDDEWRIKFSLILSEEEINEIIFEDIHSPQIKNKNSERTKFYLSKHREIFLDKEKNRQ